MRNYHLPSYDDKPAGRLKVCHAFDGEFTTTLYQRGRDRFAVQYGKEVTDDLTYGQACAYLGRALMHALSCAGRVDNRERGEG